MVAAGEKSVEKMQKKIFQHLLNVGREHLIWTSL